MINTLEADGIILRFNHRAILSGIYIKSQTGKITGLIGNNGCGKSSLLKIIMGVLEPEIKSVRINNKHTPYPYTIPGSINYLPQELFIPGFKTVKSVFRDFNADPDEFKAVFDIDIDPNDHISSLHHSTIRLIEIFVLVKSPTQFTLLDEPFTHLSPLLVECLLPFLQQEKQHKGILLTDHNFNYIKNTVDEIYQLNNARLRHLKNMEEINSYRELFE